MSVNDQQQRLQALLQPASSSATLFPPNSRYVGIETAVWAPDHRHLPDARLAGERNHDRR